MYRPLSLGVQGTVVDRDVSDTCVSREFFFSPPHLPLTTFTIYTIVFQMFLNLHYKFSQYMLPQCRVHPYLSRRDGILRSILALLRILSTDDLFTLLRELLAEVRYRFHLLETNTTRLPPSSESDSQDNP